MKKTHASKSAGSEANEMLPEYDFDYRKARPNRFAGRMGENCVVIILDPDVSQVFTTAESVNAVLRALINTMPKPTKQKPTRK